MPVCAEVWDQSHCKSGITMCSSTKDAALAVIIFHALMEVKKGDPNNRRNKDRGVMVVFQTATVSDAAASSLS